MAEIYIFSQDDEILTIISEATGLISAPFKDVLNTVPDEPFVFTVDADEERAKHVKEENRVVFKDKDGFFREMVIKEIDDIDNNDGPQTTATCLPAWLDELSENYVLDKRYTDKEAQLALDDALAGTRYIGEVEVSLGLASTNFYKLTSADCIWKIIKVWGGEFKDVVEFTGNKITKRKILIKQRLGADNGASFEIDHNIEEIQRTVLSYPKTAMYGWGASLEIEDEEGNHTGGYTRYIDFADEEWSVKKGDPVDKPKGQKWVGDPKALQRYGRKHEGTLLHRFSEFSNQEIEDPEELLWATWENLQEAQKPEMNYRLSVDMLDKDVSLGDTARALDRDFARPIEIQTRVIAIEYDLLDIEGTTVVEMGQFLDLDDDRLDRLEDYIEQNQGKWGAEAGPITNERFPDIKPGTPSNVEAAGAFQTIQLFWDYDSEVYISHYEVYGSQVKDFVPDSQHLLWRGRVSSFVHEVDTDQTWYYRVRAVNTRGTASDYSPQVSASTVRIISDDILFGSIIADHLQDNLDIADKLAQNTIDRINDGPLKEIVYTQQQIEATEERLTKELNSRIGDVSASIDDLLEKTEGIEGSVTKITQDIDTIEGRMDITIEQLTKLDSTVSEQKIAIEANTEALTFKADKTEVVNKTDYSNQMAQIDLRFDGINQTVQNTQADVDGLTDEITSAKSQIASLDVKADGIQASVSNLDKTVTSQGTKLTKAEGEIKTLAGEIELRANEIGLIDGRLTTAESKINVLPSEIDLKVTQGIDGLQVGERNLLKDSGRKVNAANAYNVADYVFTEPMVAGETYTCTIMLKITNRTQRFALYNSGGNDSLSGWVSIPSSKQGKMSLFTITFKGKEVGSNTFLRVYSGVTGETGRTEIEWIKLVKGNKATTDWSPAPEDQVDKTNVLSSINLSKEGVRIAGNKIHLTGQTLMDDAIIGTAAIANAAITRAKLGTAVVGTAQIENGAITNAKIGNLAVDDAKIADLSVNKLKAGTIDTSIIKIRGGSSTDYSLIDGSFMELRGKYKRTWLGTTTTHDVKTKLQNGHLRFRNDSLNRSLYMAEFGISTYIDGEGESGGSSGTISWWDKTYSTTGANGLTINSHGGVVALESDKNIIAINPFKDDSSSKFWFTRSNDYNDGYLSFGSNLGAPSMALRFFNGKTELAMVDSNYQRGGDTTFDVGNLKVNSIRKRDGSGGVYWNGSSGGTTAGGNLDNTLFATGIRTNDSNIYLATDNGGTVHITDYAGYNNGKGITYRDLYARQIFANTVQFNADAGGTNLYIKPSASGEVKITAPNTTDIFRPLRTSKVYETSSEKFKHDIKRFENSALDLINSSVIYDYEKEGSYGREIGFIIERETPTILINGDAIDGYSHRSLNTKAIQELDTKFYGLENRVEMLELENQYLKQKIKQLEEKIA